MPKRPARRGASRTGVADPDLQTAGERAARQALEDLDARYAEERLPLERALREAETQAEPVRYGLLYGTGDELVHAVAQVLADAGLRTVDLDKELGGTRSADLLVSADGPPWRLVEVKSASGAAPEHLVGHLERHLATWPQLRPEQPVTGGVLVVNHQHRQHPSERTAQVYSRPEFVAAPPRHGRQHRRTVWLVAHRELDRDPIPRCCSPRLAARSSCPRPAAGLPRRPLACSTA